MRRHLWQLFSSIKSNSEQSLVLFRFIYITNIMFTLIIFSVFRNTFNLSSNISLIFQSEFKRRIASGADFAHVLSDFVTIERKKMLFCISIENIYWKSLSPITLSISPRNQWHLLIATWIVRQELFLRVSIETQITFCHKLRNPLKNEKEIKKNMRDDGREGKKKKIEIFMKKNYYKKFVDFILKVFFWRCGININLRGECEGGKEACFES